MNDGVRRLWLEALGVVSVAALVMGGCMGEAMPVDGGPSSVDGAMGEPDGGSMTLRDGAPSDAPSDAPPPPAACTTDADCDDGVACSVDTCEGGHCGHATDDTACGALERCDLRRGCVDDCGDVFCNLLGPECGCAPGESCYVSHMTRVCGPTGTLGVLEACAGTNDCAPGLSCLPPLDAAVGQLLCMQLCDADADCPTGASCSGPMVDPTGTRICSHLCNIASSAPCPMGYACRLLSDGATTFCAGAGTGGQGAPCVGTEDCRGGFLCANLGSGSECTRLCNLASPSCPASTTCRMTTPAVRVRGVDFGLCS